MTSRSTSKFLQWIVFGVLFAVIAVIFALFARERLTTTKSKLPIYSVVRDFSLTNQLSQTVTLNNFLGKVWVADIIFTRCPGPCRRMTKDMARLQDLWPKETPVRFVSITSDPDYDTPTILKSYATEHKADPARWDFLTGTKEQIVEAAVDSLKFVRVEKSERERESINDLFIHSTTFMIVDKRGQVRASVETDTPDSLNQIRQIVDELLRDR